MKPALHIVDRDVKPDNPVRVTFGVVVDVDPPRRRRIGDALLRLLKSSGNPDNNKG